jgi:signal peptidase I
VKTTSEQETLEPPPEQVPAPADEAGKGIVRYLGELPVLVVIAFVIALLIKTFFLQAFFIPSGSMEPTLMPGDRVLVQKISYYFHDPRRGDIIVFEDPHPGVGHDRGLVGGFFHWMFQGLGVQKPSNEDFVKRVIGLPGETVQGKGGSVYVNGTKLDEPYLSQQTAGFPKTTVPAGSLFVMGDNRGNSLDSRFGLGFVPESKVIGQAWVVIWPPGRDGLIH